MKGRKQIYIMMILLGAIVLLTSGCQKRKNQENSSYYRYYLNVEETKIESEEYEPEATQTKEMIKEFMDKLKESAQDSSFMNLLTDGIEIQDYQYEENILIIDFNEQYLKLKKPKEVLVRAGIVRTFTQIPDMEYVRFTVEGQELLNSYGKSIGNMTKESFVENSGKEINSYLNSKITLYFANKNGDKLIAEQKNVYYSSNVPLERVVIEQLLKGPSKEETQATMSPESKILGVTIADNIGYVNLDSKFLDGVMPIEEQIPIYAITNSLIASCGVQKVQISINGETDMRFRETIDLNQFFVWNQELIEGQ